MISVVVRTKDSERTIGPLIQGLGSLDDDELIIVDSGSNDRTIRVAEGAGAKVIRLKTPFSYSASLNQGFSTAQSPWVLSLSSHCIPLNAPLLPRLRAAIAGNDAKVAVAYGSIHLSAREKIDT